MARGAFNSRAGFILAAVGSAVGIGNLWRFPYLVSTEGGAAFMIIYLGLLFVIGLPALMAELSLGRSQGKNAVDALMGDGKTRPWGLVGVMALGTSIILLSYYSVIAGWGLQYFLGTFTGAWADDAAGYFGSINEGPGALWAHLAFMAITIAILIPGVSKGIEAANLVMMPLLFATVIGLALYGNLQPGSGAGRAFYLEPDFDAVTTQTVSQAAGQTFFSIGLGIGTMLTYSSYMGKKENLQSTGMTIGFADTAVAILAGFMVFPLLFSLGLSDLVNPDNAGSAGGLFIVLPTAFAQIGGTLGLLMAIAFFSMLAFAAISSALSLLEVPVSAVVDRHPQWGRGRAVLLVGGLVYLLGIPSALNGEALGLFDLLVSNVLLLLGGLLLVIYVGWIRPEVLNEMRPGKDAPPGSFDVSRYFIPVIRYPLPIILAILLSLGLVTFVDGLLS